MAKAKLSKALGMDMIFIAGRQAFDDASELLELFGHAAGAEAAERARRSRREGNVARYCHWRQIERVVLSLARTDVAGTVH